MRVIRRLYFQNQAGQRYSLSGDNGVYASALSGFGYTLAPSYAELTRGFFVPVSDESEPQGTLPFTITFTRNPYQTYKAFVDWLSAAGTLSIVYVPSGAQEYWRDITVNFVQKTELTATGWLVVPCSFFCNTPWYLPVPTELNLEAAGTDESKRYEYSYAEDLIYGEDSSASLTGTIVGTGHVPGSVELVFHGAIVNPKIRLVGDISGKTYGICSITATFQASDTLKLSTRYEDSYVKRISADGLETDLLDALDLSTTPFFHIPVDEPCTITIGADAPFTGSAELLIFYYYRSV